MDPIHLNEPALAFILLKRGSGDLFLCAYKQRADVHIQVMHDINILSNNISAA